MIKFNIELLNSITVYLDSKGFLVFMMLLIDISLNFIHFLLCLKDSDCSHHDRAGNHS